jgi:transposase
MSHNRNPKPPYPPQFHQQMVELVAAGRKPSELAKEFGCHETSILSWVRRAAASVESTASAAPVLHANERAELIALRREIRVFDGLRAELDLGLGLGLGLYG